MSNYTMNSHPTKYADIEFRSRLEATWAAFFDLIKWRWEYEPFDLHGWAPDFVIRGAYRDVLVEVKPTAEHLKDAHARVLKSAPDACLMFLENGPIDKLGRYGPETDHALSTTLGWAWSPFYRDRGRDQIPSFSVQENETTGEWDAHIDGERYVGFHSGVQLDDAHYLGHENSGFSPFGDLRPIWKRATNITRWKPS